MKNLAGKRQQNGAALIVGLILLVVITVLAVSGMNTATTELAMVRNDQSAENAFQAAETGLEIALGQPMYPTDSTLTISRDLNRFDQVTVDVGFDRETVVTDRAFSLGSGISAFHFVAEAKATSERGGIGNGSVRDASAAHTQAFYIVGPQGNAL